jgi:hypothetical protein
MSKKDAQAKAAELPPEVAAKVARRAKLHADHEAAREAVRAADAAVTAALTAGGSGADVDGRLVEQDRARRLEAALSAALQQLDKEIPTLRVDAGRAGAMAFVAAVPRQHAALVKKIAAAAAPGREQAARLAATLKVEEGLRMDEARLRQGLRLLAARFDGLTVPALPLPPPREDLLAEPLRVALREARVPWFDVACPAGASAAERAAATLGALRRYCDRHRAVVPPEVLRLLLLAGIPEAEKTPEEQAKRDAKAVRKAEEARRFADGVESAVAMSVERRNL